jgi:D-serine deaminase-like pyridoxal phosphate-dependent protein
VLVAAGFEDVLVANQVLGADKLRRLAGLNAKADVKVCVDAAEQVEMLSAAAREAGVEIGVLAELDVGMARCGVADSAALLDLAGRVDAAGGLRLRGLQGYEGHACFIADPEERRRAASAAAGKLAAARRDLEAAGVRVEIVSAGGTGTHDVTGLVEGIDELQVGSYALMDGRYRTVRDDFDNALFVLSSVVSAQGDRAVFDVGYKSAGAELRPPAVVGLDREPTGFKLNEEHLRLDGVGGRFRVGRKVRMIPWHGCTTCNLYPRFHVVDGEEVVEEWPIEGAGLRS